MANKIKAIMFLVTIKLEILEPINAILDYVRSML